jgi:hypothetical protein
MNVTLVFKCQFYGCCHGNTCCSVLQMARPTTHLNFLLKLQTIRAMLWELCPSKMVSGLQYLINNVLFFWINVSLMKEDRASVYSLIKEMG